MEGHPLGHLSGGGPGLILGKALPAFTTCFTGAAMFTQNRPARLGWSIQGGCGTQGSALLAPGFQVGPGAGRLPIPGAAMFAAVGRKAAREKEAARRGEYRLLPGSRSPDPEPVPGLVSSYLPAVSL